MRLLLTIMALYLSSAAAIKAQSFPIANADELQQLVVQPDLAKIKLLIFDDTYVYADRFLYFSILQGLAKDTMPQTIAQSLAAEAQGPNFVPKCKICSSTKSALMDYEKYGAAFNGEANKYPDLTSKDAALRHKAIKALTDRYTSAFITLLQLSDLEQQHLQDKLIAMRKQGMVGLKDDFGSKGCPSCDGATHKKD